VKGEPGEPVPVRIKFINQLPATGAGGDLFLPVDETVMGSGLGPALPGAAGDKYTQNRATITCTATTPSGSATATFTSGLRPLLTARLTRRA